MTINPAEAYGTHKTVAKVFVVMKLRFEGIFATTGLFSWIWERFRDTFGVLE